MSDKWKPKGYNISDKSMVLGKCEMPHIICIENLFPKTHTFSMTVKDGKVFKSQKVPKGFMLKGIDKVTLAQPENIGTQRTGKGDSGTGHWIMNYETYPPKAVLVAISTWSIVNTEESQTGYLSTHQKTTWKNILDFIKGALVFFEEL